MGLLDDAFNNSFQAAGEQSAQGDQKPAEESGQAAAEEIKIDLSSLNKRFNQNFESEDQLASIFSLPEKLKQTEEESGKYKIGYEEYQAKISDYEKKIEELSKPIDYASFFANEKLLKTNELLKKYPGKDVEVMSKIVEAEEDKLSDFDVLTLNELLENPKIKGGEKGAKELIAHKYQLDLEDLSSISDLSSNLMAKDAGKVRESIKSMKAIELPTLDLNKVKSDSELAQKQAYENKLKISTPIVEKMLGDFKKYTISDVDDKGNRNSLLEYDVVLSEEESQGIKSAVNNYLASVDKVDETVAANALRLRDNLFWDMKKADIIKHYAGQLQAKAKDDMHKTLHNDSDLSSKERTQASGDWASNFASNIKK